MLALRPLIAAAAVAALAAVPAAATAKPRKLTVMSRNLYLGADLTEGTNAGSLQELVDAAGEILNQVDRNDFPVRSKGLAAEILRKRPDLVGLQETALWRTEPCTQSPTPPHAKHVRYDYLRLLLRRLNAGHARYRVVVSEPEFDFEVWANTDGDESTSAPGCPFGSEINGRLTMRDVILARRGRVRTSHARGGHFRTLLQERPGGVPVNVTRGWTRADVRVRGSRTLRFVNTHLEAFDSQPSNHRNNGGDVGRGRIRQAQARELIARHGPARSRHPVILVGDLNSDVATRQKPGDQLAYRALLNGGFAERSLLRPFGCCLDSAILRTSAGGSRSDFDHKVDHVMTDSPRRIRLLGGAVTGLRPVNGFWDSDHAGLVSRLGLVGPARARFTG